MGRKTDRHQFNAILDLAHDASEIAPYAYHAFQFIPLSAAPGEFFAFCLKVPMGDLIRPVTALGYVQDVYPDGQAAFCSMWGETVGVQDPGWSVCYTMPAQDKLRVSMTCLEQNRPSLLDDWRFYIALLTADLVLLYAFFCRLTRQSFDCEI